MSLFCMKSRQILSVVTVIAFGSFIYINFLSPAPPPTWQYIYSQTQNQLAHLKKLNEKPQLDAFAEISEYLRILDFDETWHIISDATVDKILPTVVIPAGSGSFEVVASLLSSLGEYLPSYLIVIYDIGMGYWEKNELKQKCDAMPVCRMQDFDFTLYPSHVKNLKLKSYQPIIIQEMLNSTGAVIYLTPSHRVISASVEPVLAVARNSGFAAWSLDDSTSAITHPKMFTFFQTTSQRFYFHRTVSDDRIVVYNTKRIHEKLMRPWLQCSLTAECVKPIGSQDTGCRTWRKPLYLYSGCHNYDQSALNVVLGLMFEFRSDSYAVEKDYFLIDSKKLLMDGSKGDAKFALSSNPSPMAHKESPLHSSRQRLTST